MFVGDSGEGDVDFAAAFMDSSEAPISSRRFARLRLVLCVFLFAVFVSCLFVCYFCCFVACLFVCLLGCVLFISLFVFAVLCLFACFSVFVSPFVAFL